MVGTEVAVSVAGCMVKVAAVVGVALFSCLASVALGSTRVGVAGTAWAQADNTTRHNNQWVKWAILFIGWVLVYITAPLSASWSAK